MTALLVIATLILLITASYLYGRLKRGPAYVAEIRGSSVKALDPADFRLEMGIFYHAAHTWSALEPRGSVRIGIDDFLQKLTGTIDTIQAPEIDQQIGRGESLLTLQLGPHHLDVPTPLSGTITNINTDILSKLPAGVPGALNREWVVELAPSRLSEELPDLTVAEKAREWFHQEIDRFKEFLLAQTLSPAVAGATLPDGGTPVEGVLRLLDEDGITQFEKVFLRHEATQHA